MIGQAAMFMLLELIVLLELEQSLLRWLLEYIIPPFLFIFVALFCVGYLFPKLWINFERLLWKILLGRSSDSQWVINYAIKDYQLLIKEKEHDESVQHTLAVLLAARIHMRHLPRMYGDLKRMRDGRVEGMFTEAINKLNEGWRSGTPAELLERYIIIIKELADNKLIDKRERLRGLSSVALVTYAMGNLKAGNSLGKSNWDDADRLNPEDQLEGKWMAAYALFNSTMFLGEFEKAMKMMTSHWSTHYAPLTQKEKTNLIENLSKRIALNPVLTMPRHIILASAFNDGPGLQGDNSWQDKWPSEGVFEKLNSDDRKCEIKWGECWYEEAKRICNVELISLNFSHAYAGFYFTLLLGDPKVREEDLHEKINEAFNAIADPAPIVSQYVKYGFSGVYHLVCNRNDEALESLRLAAVSASISGNGFAECIFMCCHALAAARVDHAVDTEIDYYLKEAEKLANIISGDFYPALSAAAVAAVSRLRGENGRAERYKLRSEQGKKGRRILRIFLPQL